MRVISLFRNLAFDRRGAAAVEAALVMPVLLVSMAGLIDGGRAILQALQLQAAAQAGADYARKHGDDDMAGIGAAAQQATPLTVSLSPAPTTQDGCATKDGIKPAKKKSDTCPGNTEPGTWLIVTASAPFTTLMPWGGANWQPNMHAVASVRID